MGESIPEDVVEDAISDIREVREDVTGETSQAPRRHLAMAAGHLETALDGEGGMDPDLVRSAMGELGDASYWMNRGRFGLTAKDRVEAVEDRLADVHAAIRQE